MFDVIIIGKGPAGISASLYTLRSNLKTLIIGKESLLEKTLNIENYYGIIKISGKDLLKTGEEQVKRLGGEILEDEVLDIKLEGNIKKVITKDKEFETKSILIATGDKKINLKIDNMKRFEGNGISFCTVCDGFFFRGLKVGVLGYNDYAVSEGMELLNFTNNVTIFTNGKELEVTDNYKAKLSNFKINNKVIDKFLGENELDTICFSDGTKENINGIFVAYGSANSNMLAKKIGILEKDNHILVNDFYETNVTGIFAAGDCTGVFKQISVAVGQGAIAGNSIIKYVRNN